MKRFKVKYSGEKIQGKVELPGSKSIANRLLLIKDLAGSKARLDGLPDCEDTVLMIKLLEVIRKMKDATQNLGYPNTSSLKSGLKTGSPENLVYPNPIGSQIFSGGIAEIDCGNTGTVLRFLTSYLSITPGKWLLTGTERMLQRPVGALVNALLSLGADIQYIEKNGFPPLLISGKPLKGGDVSVESSQSSQFASSLLMIAPLLTSGLNLNLKGQRVSEPYLNLTLRLMEQNGINIETSQDGFYISHQNYTVDNQWIEKDWSAASCWFETLALSEDGELFLEGLMEDSLQGDKELLNIYKKLGVYHLPLPNGILLTKKQITPGNLVFDMKNFPDLVPSLAGALAGNHYTGQISGIEHLRIKESDRISAIDKELKELGYNLEITANNLIFNTKRTVQPSFPICSSHHDHRIAMAIAPLALKTKELIIEDAMAVTKSYPEFWYNLQRIGFQVVEI